MAMDSATRVMSGTHGNLWIDGEEMAEVYKFQAKYTLDKEEIFMAGSMMPGEKIKSVKGTGSVGIHKVDAKMARKLADAIQQGKDVRCTIVSELKDPDAYSHERIAIKGVSFGEITLADWERGTLGKIEMPFTFTNHQFLD